MPSERASEYALEEPGAPRGEDAHLRLAGTDVMRIFALGRARVEKDGRLLDSPDLIQKPRELLYYLLSHPEGRTKEQIGLDLWPEASTARLRSSFHDTLFRLRRALGAKECVVYEKRRYAFGGSLGYSYDVRDFEENITEARRLQTEAPEEAIGHLQKAADLYGGDYLEDLAVKGEWAFERQEELRRTFQEALLLLGGMLLDQDRHEEAADAYRRAIAQDTYLEVAHRGLMRSYASLGERARALEHYRDLVEILREGPGTAPGSETEDLFEELLRGGGVVEPAGAGLPPAAPPLEEPRARTDNLPLQTTPLVGREREVGEVARRVRSGKARLLTLTGPGGTGKTRVALAAGSDLVEEFPDGVCFVSLTAVHDPDLVPSAIAGPLGVKESANQPLLETLKGYLLHKELLLILDNFEQVLEGTPLVVELLRSCPGLRVLVTSRIPLRLYGEQEYPVPPLAVPDSRSLPPLEDLANYGAVGLFVERARSVNADFSLTGENASAVAEICARLDGLPLAIELAAARVRTIAPQTMLSRLGNRLTLLRGGPRDLPVRQRTLRGTIEWSFGFLEDQDKALFARLSVFAGGGTLRAIEEVCDSGGDPDVLDGVESLLEKSLLRRAEEAGGEPRFDMLETIDEYASERLEESGEAEGIKRAHAEYFLALAERASPELKGSDQVRWLRRLEAEHDNMRAALEWALQREETEVLLGLGGALWWFWSVRGHYSEGRRWLEEALAAGRRGSPGSRAMALAGVGNLARDQGDLDRAEEASAEGLELLMHEPTEPGEARLYLLLTLGHVASEREDYGRASELLEESLALSREMGHGWGLASSVMSLATISHEQDDLERATKLYEESIGLFRERGAKLGLAWGLNNLGLVLYSMGDSGRAAELTEESVALLRELGAGADTAAVLGNLGWMALIQNDPGGATDLFEESLQLARDTGLHPMVLTSLEGLACVAGAKGEARRAARLWGATQALQQARGVPRDTDWMAEADARMSAVRSALGEQAWEEASKGGRNMTLEEAVAAAGGQEANG